MKHRNRAWRRAQRERLIARGYRYLKSVYHDTSMRRDADWADHWVRQYLGTRCPCSRHCCGNPRHHFDGIERITMQERRQNEADRLD